MPLTIVSRAQWAARPATSTKKMLTPVSEVYVHHSTGPVGPDEAKLVRGFQAFHMDKNGWSDIAYSFLIGQSGKVYVGRGWNRVGAHTKNHNASAIGICFIGNTDKVKPSAAAIAAYIGLIRAGVRRGSLTRTITIRGHRAVSATACPGKNLYAALDEIRRGVAGPTTKTDFVVEDAKGTRTSHRTAAAAWQKAKPRLEKTGHVIITKRTRRLS